MTKKKKKHFTFRLDEDLHKSLEDEAERLGITPTMLMGKLTKNHLERDKFLTELGFLPLGKDFVKVWLERIDNKNIKEDARLLGISVIKDYVTYFFHKSDSDSLMKFLELWLTTQGKFRKTKVHGLQSYTIHHNINQKFSLFLEGFLFCIIENTLKTKVSLTETTSNLLSFTFEVK